jgi:hypothetical protein
MCQRLTGTPRTRSARPPVQRTRVKLVNRHIRRTLAGTLLAGSLALGATVFSAPAGAESHLVTASDPAAGAVYLASQLVDGNHLVFSFDGVTPDYGLSADTAIALAASGVGTDTVNAIADYLLTAANVYDYVADPDNGAPLFYGGPYPGSYAKLSLVAMAAGRNASGLLASLSALQCPGLALVCSSWEDGLFKNTNTANGSGYPGIFAQTFDVLALLRGGVVIGGVTGAALTLGGQNGAAFLRAQQCTDGSWKNTVSDQTVTKCAIGGNVDATAMAVEALKAAGTPDPGSVTALASAVSWLQSHAATLNGGYVSDTTDNASVVNANSTGLVATALAIAGVTAAAPLGWLTAAQFGCADTQVAAAALGSVSFTGIDTVSGSDTRATTSAVLGFSAANYLSVTVTGDVAALPTLTCTAPTPVATPTPTPVVSDTAVTDVAAAEQLSATGSADRSLAVLAVVLIMVGFGAVVVSRRGLRR